MENKSKMQGKINKIKSIFLNSNTWNINDFIWFYNCFIDYISFVVKLV